MLLSQIEQLNKASLKMLESENTITEAYHPKDREALDNIRDMAMHHSAMQGRHRSAQGATSKDKEMTKHDLAILAHEFAAKHYAGMGANIGGYGMGYGAGLPHDYHQDREFYDKLNGMVTKRADTKSKECGIDCNTDK